MRLLSAGRRLLATPNAAQSTLGSVQSSPQTGTPLSASANQHSLAGLVYVAIAVVLFSTSPVLIRFAADVSAYEITFGRMFVAAAAVGAGAWLNDSSFALGLRSLLRFAVYGLIAALHFLLYNASLSYTTIAHSLALVYTAPVFVTLFAWLLIGERLPWRKWLGIPVVVAGIAVLAGFEPAFDARMLLGDLLALGSAICFGLYSIAGRQARNTYPLLTYAALVYGFAALWLLPFAALQGTGRWTISALSAVFALGAGPLALGHTLYNASLRRTHPTYVNLVAAQEVTGGVLLGALILGEMPGPSTLVGVALTLVGVALVLRG